MEEDKSEEGPLKKEKKHKKKRASHRESCMAEEENQAVVIKRKKKDNKADRLVEEEEESWNGKGENEQKTKRKKKNTECGSLSDTNSCYVADGEDKKESKKKKKKLLEDEVNQKEHGQYSLKVEGGGETQTKVKKVKLLSVQIKSENIQEEEAKHYSGNDNMIKKDRKKKRDVPAVSTEQMERTGKKKEKKKGSQVFDEDVTKDEAEVAESGSILESQETEVEMVKLKKKKKRKTKSEENEDELEATEKECKKTTEEEGGKAHNGKKYKSPNGEIVVGEEGKAKKRKKEKRRTASVEDAEVEAPVKKKKGKPAEEDLPLVQCGQEDSCGIVMATADAQSKKNKKKKSSIKVEEATNSGAEAKKKKKVKEEQAKSKESVQVEGLVPSHKSGNTDEVTIDQDRRQTLQMETDRSSPPEKSAQSSGFGQWSTAQFDSANQQQKFLRLMGGFKKGFQPAVTSGGGAKMALGKKAQQELQQGLLGQFERAHSRGMDFNNRGAGLGFAAPSNKKFSIDINASRSVRFDD